MNSKKCSSCLEIFPATTKYFERYDKYPSSPLKKLCRLCMPKGPRGIILQAHRRKGFCSKTYKTWGGMWSRCTDTKKKDYINYGGRGIKVCERWESFWNFLQDMGEKPPGMTIDRIDNDGNYEPGNCRWATTAEQNAHRRQPGRIHITFNGRTQSLAQWCRELGFSPGTLKSRIANWGSLEAAFNTPRLPTNWKLGKKNVGYGKQSD